MLCTSAMILFTFLHHLPEPKVSKISLLHLTFDVVAKSRTSDFMFSKLSKIFKTRLHYLIMTFFKLTS